MKEKMLVFSILTLLIGLEVYFVLTNLIGKLFLGGAAVVSVMFFLYGILKDKERQSHQIRSWSGSLTRKIKKKK